VVRAFDFHIISCVFKHIDHELFTGRGSKVVRASLASGNTRQTQAIITRVFVGATTVAARLSCESTKSSAQREWAARGSDNNNFVPAKITFDE